MMTHSHPKHCMQHEQRVAGTTQYIISRDSSWAISLADIKRWLFERDMPGVEKSWY